MDTPDDPIRVCDGATKRPTDITGCIIPYLDGEPLCVEFERVKFVPIFSPGDRLSERLGECFAIIGLDSLDRVTLKRVDDGRAVVMAFLRCGVRAMLDPRVVRDDTGRRVTRYTEVLPEPRGSA